MKIYLTKLYNFSNTVFVFIVVRLKVTNAFLSLRGTSQFHGIPKDLATGPIVALWSSGLWVCLFFLQPVFCALDYFYHLGTSLQHNFSLVVERKESMQLSQSHMMASTQIVNMEMWFLLLWLICLQNQTNATLFGSNRQPKLCLRSFKITLSLDSSRDS